MEHLRRAIDSAIRKLKFPFHAVVENSKDAFYYTLAKALSELPRKDVERLGHYGFVSRAPVGSRVLVVPRGGKLVIVSEEHKTTLTLAEGDVAVERETGEKIHLKDGTITVEGALIELGEGAIEPAVLGEKFMTLFNNHVHQGNLGAPTGPPVTPMAATELAEKTVVA